MRQRAFAMVCVAMFLFATTLVAQVQFSGSAPPKIRLGAVSGGVTTDVDAGMAAVFIPVTPCRLVDTRLANGPYGGPKLIGTRTFNMINGPCADIPSGAVAYAVSLGVTQNTTGGFITAWPTGSPKPLVAQITWSAGQTLSTGAVIAAGTDDSVDVASGVSTHFTMDLNGYYIGDAAMNSGQRLTLFGDDQYGMVEGFNFNTSSSWATGLWGEVSGSQDFTSGAYAVANSEVGITNGLWGATSSADAGAAGVIGRAGAAAWYDIDYLPGVYGVADGNQFALGVLGQSTYAGVAGMRVDSGGTVLTSGFVGSTGSDGFWTGFNMTALGTKSFVEPDPNEAGAVIKYVALEGPEAGTYFRGKAAARNGRAVISVPSDFRDVTHEEGLTVQITPIGGSADYHVASYNLHEIVVRTSKDIEFFYTVNGVRRAFKDFMPRQREPEERYFVPASSATRIEEITTNPEIQRRLIANGTFNADGSVNMSMAESRGWAAEWRAQAEAKKEKPQRRGHDLKKVTKSKKKN